MTDKKWNVAVVGALGMVGTDMVKTLAIRRRAPNRRSRKEQIRCHSQ